MDWPELEWLLQGEGPQLEYKRGAPADEDILKILVGFANDYEQRGGGWLLCGVEETRDDHGFRVWRPVGLDSASYDALSQRIVPKCQDLITPPLELELRGFVLPEAPERRILAFHVQPTGKVHSLSLKRKDGPAVFIQRDQSTFAATDPQLRELMLRSGELPSTLDEPCRDASVDDIDLVALQEYLKPLHLPHPATAYLSPDVRIRPGVPPLVAEIAQGTKRLAPTRLAMLLFGRDPLACIPGASCLLTTYQGDSRSAPRSQSVRLEGLPLPWVVQETLAALRARAGLDIQKDAAAGRPPNKPRFHERALQEAVVNAFVHRDYRSKEPVRIDVFTDRVEIASPGDPLQGRDIELFNGRLGHFPHAEWRNTSLARFMEDMSLAQTRGQGLPTIFTASEELSGVRPEIRLDPGWFVVTLFSVAPSKAPPVGRSPGVVAISIGGGSLMDMVRPALQEHGLSEAELLMDYSVPGFIESEDWPLLVTKLRAALWREVDVPGVDVVHLFYKGPVATALLLGAVLSRMKPTVVYEYSSGRYLKAYVLDKRLLVQES